MSSKLVYAQQLQQHCSTLAQVSDALADLETVYVDRGYKSGDGDQIIDAEVLDFGITAADIDAAIILIRQLKNFLGNATVISGDYGSTLNKLRTDV